MIGEATGIGVVLFDPQSGIGSKQTVQNKWGFMGGRGDNPCVIGTVLIGDMSIEGKPRCVSASSVDQIHSFADTCPCSLSHSAVSMSGCSPLAFAHFNGAGPSTSPATMESAGFLLESLLCRVRAAARTCGSNAESTRRNRPNRQSWITPRAARTGDVAHQPLETRRCSPQPAAAPADHQERPWPAKDACGRRGSSRGTKPKCAAGGLHSER